MSRLMKILVFIIAASVVSSCKLAVIVVEGGEVESTGSGTCMAGTVCIVEVNDTNFTETFTAVPDEGWYFEKWNSGDGFWCAESTDPACAISSVAAAGRPAWEAFIAAPTTYYIMPIFKMGNPITDTVTVDDKEWTQVDLFTNLSWNDINAVCPAGICSGTLNGYDVTGWTWASSDDVRLLFQTYEEAGIPLHQDFEETLFDRSHYILAIVRDRPDIEGAITAARIFWSVENNLPDTLDFIDGTPELSFSALGAWFWSSID